MVLTIALCTRNRVLDLHRCLVSLSDQKRIKKENIEILIIDDGNLSLDELDNLKNIVKKYQFAYHKKQKTGLFLSRLEAIKRCKSSITLFLDDDVVLYENYLFLLFEKLNLCL